MFKAPLVTFCLLCVMMKKTTTAVSVVTRLEYSFID